MASRAAAAGLSGTGVGALCGSVGDGELARRANIFTGKTLLELLGLVDAVRGPAASPVPLSVPRVAGGSGVFAHAGSPRPG